jgi:hypothetical protein
VPSFGGCAAVVGIFSGVVDGPGRIRARQKKVGNKLRRWKLVAAVADDDGAADSNGASSGDGEDAAPTAPDRESIVCLLSLSLCVSVRVCPFPFLQTLNPNSRHFLDAKSAAFNWRLVSDFQSPHVFLRSQKKKKRRSCGCCSRILHYQCLLFREWIRVVVLGGVHKSISRILCCFCFRAHILSCNDDIYHSLFCFSRSFLYYPMYILPEF